MTFQTNETIKRLWSDFLREQLAAIPPEQRRNYEQQFEDSNKPNSNDLGSETRERVGKYVGWHLKR